MCARCACLAAPPRWAGPHPHRSVSEGPLSVIGASGERTTETSHGDRGTQRGWWRRAAISAKPIPKALHAHSARPALRVAAAAFNSHQALCVHNSVPSVPLWFVPPKHHPHRIIPTPHLRTPALRVAPQMRKTNHRGTEDTEKGHRGVGGVVPRSPLNQCQKPSSPPSRGSRLQFPQSPLCPPSLCLVSVVRYHTPRSWKTAPQDGALVKRHQGP
jgi:hypothetical protein